MLAMFAPSQVRRSGSVIGAVIFLIFVAVPALMRAQNPNGALRGEVQDASGARLASARVVVQSIGSSITREAAANERGEFRIEGLLPGFYRVAVTAKGFAQATADVDVAVSLVRDIAVTLKPQSERETVNVRGNSSSITTQSVDTASAVHEGAVGSRDLETLPLPARSFANIAYLVPGTEPVEPSDPTKARITAVSIGNSCRPAEPSSSNRRHKTRPVRQPGAVPGWTPPRAARRRSGAKRRTSGAAASNPSGRTLLQRFENQQPALIVQRFGSNSRQKNKTGSTNRRRRFGRRSASDGGPERT